MPTIEENIGFWTQHDWSKGGDEWSVGWGGSHPMWHTTLLPRIAAYLPTGSILEIAVGHGRWTRFLLRQCEKFVGVDLVPEVLEVSKKRFADASHASFHVNDGLKLPMVDDASIDFAFSYDSLVHVERDVIESYAGELARVLKPGGYAFLHHSNMGQHLLVPDDPSAGLTEPNTGYRGITVSSVVAKELFEAAGLWVIGQERVQWGGKVYNDCMSLVHRPTDPSAPRPESKQSENPHFSTECHLSAGRASFYCPLGKTIDQL
ncbi:MAG: class I SAM-dependent methyltransferase [Planctomycetota bacterium]